MRLVEVGIQVPVEIAGITEANKVRRELCRANIDVVTLIQCDGRLVSTLIRNSLRTDADGRTLCENDRTIHGQVRRVARYG
jgi:hypothetical protein